MYKTNLMPTLQEKSASGAVATFNTALAMPLASCNIAVNAWQEGSGDPSPVNIRPIHGFDKLHINMCNFNQLVRNGNFESASGWSGANGTISVSNNTGVYTVTRISSGNANRAEWRPDISYVSKHKYFFMFSIKVPRNQVVSVTAYSVAISAATLPTTQKNVPANSWFNFASISRGVGTGIGDLRIGIHSSNDTEVGDVSYIKNVNLIDLTQMFGEKIADYLYSLETQTAGAGVALFKQIFYKDYYAYNVGGTWVSVASVNGDSYPDYAEIQLGEEVYGAEVDVVNGVAHVTHSYREFDGSEDEEWERNVNLEGFNLLLSDMSTGSYQAGLCDKFKTVSNTSSTGIRFGLDSSRRITVMRLSDYLPEITVEAWRTWLETNNISVVYPLAEPFDIQLTPTQIETIIGNSTIFADTGDVDLTYKDLDIAKRDSFREVFKLPS